MPDVEGFTRDTQACLRHENVVRTSQVTVDFSIRQAPRRFWRRHVDRRPPEISQNPALKKIEWCDRRVSAFHHPTVNVVLSVDRTLPTV